MTEFQRYAIYWAPGAGALADKAAAWLGWDPVLGCDRAQPALAGLPLPLSEITDTPRKYGFHATIKPPFRLVDGASETGLDRALGALAGRLAPVVLPGLRLAQLGNFLALTPESESPALAALAAQVVRDLDPYRAPLSPEDIIRRQIGKLSDSQRDLLDRWGYPYVMDEYRFHLTLTGKLACDQAKALQPILADYLGPDLPRPFALDELCLFGEARDGRFHILNRYALTGGASSSARMAASA